MAALLLISILFMVADCLVRILCIFTVSSNFWKGGTPLQPSWVMEWLIECNSYQVGLLSFTNVQQDIYRIHGLVGDLTWFLWYLMLKIYLCFSGADQGLTSIVIFLSYFITKRCSLHFSIQKYSDLLWVL